MSDAPPPRIDTAQASSGATGSDGASGPTEAWYRRLVEHSPDGICVYRDARVVFVNAAGVRMMQANSAAELIGRPVTDFVAPDSIPPMLTDLARLSKAGDCSPPFPATMIRSDGSGLAVEVLTVKMVWEGRDAFQVVTRDVSGRRAAEAALRYQAALVNHVSDAIIGTSAQGAVTSWNPAAENIYGRPAADTIGRPITTVVGAALDPAAIVASGGIIAARHRAIDGRVLDVRVSAAAMADGYVLVCSDLTALRRAEHHFEAVVAAMMEGVIVTDMEGRIKSINPAATRALGMAEDASLIGVNFFEATEPFPFYNEDGVNIPPEDRPVLAVLRTGVPFENLVSGWDYADGRKWLLSSCRLLEPERLGQSDMLISFADITSQRAEAEEMRFLATHDALTGLPNRAAVLKRITEALDAAPDVALHAAPAVALRAVLFVDVDDLKATNDSLGHEAGDDVLRTTAQRLCQTVTAGDVVGRWAGDEFVVLVFSLTSSAELADLVDRLHAGLALPASISGTTIPISASIGVVEVHPFEQRTSSEILRDADLAMYEAKRGRR